MKAVVVRRERFVPIPIDVVWQLISDADTLASWLPLADRSELVSGEGVGRRQRMSGKWGRKSFEIEQEVIAFEENALLKWRHVDERLDGAPAPRISSAVIVSVRLTSTGPGTRVVLESINEPANPFAALMLRLVAAPRIRRAFDRALANLASAAG